MPLLTRVHGRAPRELPLQVLQTQPLTSERQRLGRPGGLWKALISEVVFNGFSGVVMFFFLGFHTWDFLGLPMFYWGSYDFFFFTFIRIF